jgi:hypothetical protein
MRNKWLTPPRDTRPRLAQPDCYTGSVRDWLDIWAMRRQMLAFRKEQGWTQAKLAEVTGICIWTIRHIENGRHAAYPCTWIKFHELQQRYEQAQRRELLPTRWD